MGIGLRVPRQLGLGLGLRLLGRTLPSAAALGARNPRDLRAALEPWQITLTVDAHCQKTGNSGLATTCLAEPLLPLRDLASHAILSTVVIAATQGYRNRSNVRAAQGLDTLRCLLQSDSTNKSDDTMSNADAATTQTLHRTAMQGMEDVLSLKSSAAELWPREYWRWCHDLVGSLIAERARPPQSSSNLQSHAQMQQATSDGAAELLLRNRNARRRVWREWCRGNENVEYAYQGTEEINTVPSGEIGYSLAIVCGFDESLGTHRLYHLGSGEEEQIEHEVARADPKSEYLSVAARAARRRSIADVLLAARDVLVLRRGFGVGKGLGLGLDDSDVSEALNAGEIAEAGRHAIWTVAAT